MSHQPPIVAIRKRIVNRIWKNTCCNSDDDTYDKKRKSCSVKCKTVQLFDRFLVAANNNTIWKEKLHESMNTLMHRVGIVCLHLAWKLEDSTTIYKYSNTKMADMEFDVLRLLNFNGMMDKTIYDFLEELVHENKSNHFVFDVMDNYTQLVMKVALLDYELASHHPSRLALAVFVLTHVHYHQDLPLGCKCRLDGIDIQCQLGIIMAMNDGKNEKYLENRPSSKS